MSQKEATVCQANDLYNHTITGDIACSITSNTGTSAAHAGPTVLCMNELNDVSHMLNTVNLPSTNKIVYENNARDARYKELKDVSETLKSSLGTGGNNQPLVVCRNGTENPDCNGTLQSKANGGWNANSQNIVRQTNCVRRLTPLECERLQGYPDGWTDIPGAADSKRYKALGNSIALPFWEHLARRFFNMGDVKTIGSLFDGIGGFPLCFYRAGAKTLWTSEIEPFPIQVVHERFDEDGNLKKGWK